MDALVNPRALCQFREQPAPVRRIQLDRVKAELATDKLSYGGPAAASRRSASALIASGQLRSVGACIAPSTRFEDAQRPKAA